MKKILVLVAATLLAASSSFGAVSSTDSNSLDWENTGLGLYGDADDAAGDTKTTIGRTSTGVSVAWQTSVNAYALMTQHKSGTKAYGSSYDSTAIYQTKGSAVPGEFPYNGGALTASDTTDFVSDEWSSM